VREGVAKVVVAGVAKVVVAVHEDDRGTWYALQHREINRVTVKEAKREFTATRSLTPLQSLARRNKLITEDMLIEGQKFKADYDTSKLDPLRAAPLDRFGGCGSLRLSDERDRVQAAKDRVSKIMKMFSRPHRKMLWPALEKIVGMEMSVTSAAGTRGIEQKTWQAYLIMALAALVDIRNGDLKKAG
jgi:hypothetical protein